MREQLVPLDNFAEDPATFGFWVRALTTEELLDRLEAEECLDLAQPLTVLDFGSGSGAPTSVIARLMEESGGTVDAVEHAPNRAQKLIEREILPLDRVFVEEGIAFLRSRPNTYDLITAFAFGPDTQGGFASAFIRSAQQALLPEGKILITSDEETMRAVRMVCSGWRVDYEAISGISDLEGYITDVVIVNK